MLLGTRRVSTVADLSISANNFVSVNRNIGIGNTRAKEGFCYNGYIYVQSLEVLSKGGAGFLIGGVNFLYGTCV